MKTALQKRVRRGFRGYPVATVAYYGPTDRLATKVCVGIVPGEGMGATELERWHTETADIRTDPDIHQAILDFIRAHGARSVVLADRIIGCPHAGLLRLPPDDARIAMAEMEGRRLTDQARPWGRVADRSRHRRTIQPSDERSCESRSTR